MTGRTPAQTLAIGGGAILSAVLVGIGGFKAVDLTARATDHYHSSYAQPIQHVVVDSAARSVSIEGTPGSTTTVETTINETIRHQTPRAQVVGDTLHLSGGCEGFRVAECDIRYRINVPSTVDISVQAANGGLSASHLDADVSLNTASGQVSAADISGAVSLNSESGHVSAAGVSGGPISLRTASGSISAANISADRTTARTESGRVFLELSSPPRSVQASSASGSVHVVLPRGTARYHLNPSSAAGHISLDGIASDASSPRTVDASTGSGRIDISYAD